MDYKYRVIRRYTSGPVTQEINVKFDTFDRAFNCFIEDVNFYRYDCISDSWSVSMWNEADNTLILALDDSDCK